MKLNYKRTFLIGLAFLSISAFWQMYDNIIPLILQNTFHLNESLIGGIMAIDNVLAVFLLPIIGTLSDKVDTRMGKRMPFVVFGTIAAVCLMMLLPYADENQILWLFVAALALTLIAMAMYRHWRMNGDETFLHDTALPVMRGAAEFYLGMLQKETDGLYHIHGTTAYEGTPLFHDTLTDLVMVRALFGALMRYASPEEKTLYTDILTHLPEPVLVQPDADEVKDGRLLLGIGAGRPVHGEGLVLTVGRDDDGNPVRKNYGDPAKECYGFPDTEMSPLYPAGIFGLKDKGTPLFDAMTNQILLHHTADECMYWCMMPLYLARMGMAEELYRHMESMAGTWLSYPCGLGAERIAGKLDKLERLFYNDVTDCDAYRDVSDYYSGSSKKTRPTASGILTWKRCPSSRTAYANRCCKAMTAVCASVRPSGKRMPCSSACTARAAFACAAALRRSISGWRSTACAARSAASVCRSISPPPH